MKNKAQEFTLEFTKRELELIAHACLALAASDRVNGDDSDTLDYLHENFSNMADEMEDEYDD